MKTPAGIRAAVLRLLSGVPPVIPCKADHRWRDIYGDEINCMDCRSVCLECGSRSQRLMNTTREVNDDPSPC